MSFDARKFDLADSIAEFASKRFGLSVTPIRKSRRINERYVLSQATRNRERIGNTRYDALLQYYNSYSRSHIAPALAHFFSEARTPFDKDQIFYFLNIPFRLSAESSINPFLISPTVQHTFEKDFSFFLYEKYGYSSITSVNMYLCEIMAACFISSDIVVFETDFSHKGNIVPKYHRSVSNKKVSLLPSMPEEGNLIYLNPDLKSRLKDGVIFSHTSSLSDLFSWYDEKNNLNEWIRSALDINYSSYYFIGLSRESYTSVFIFPHIYRINRNSKQIDSLINLFSANFSCLYMEANYRLQRNIIRSRLRHTIEVQFNSLKENFEALVASAQSSKEPQSEELAPELLSIEEALGTIGRDIHNQFSNEYDALGRPIDPLAELQYVPEAMDAREFIAFVLGAARTVQRAGFDCIVNFEVSEDFSVYVPDSEIFWQALREFLQNAAKYNDGEEAIRVHAWVERTDAKITISNIGPALRTAESDEIPRMGLRGRNSKLKTDQGTGQGLASAIVALNQIGVDAHYNSEDLAPEQKERLSVWRAGRYPLERHVVELTADAQ